MKIKTCILAPIALAASALFYSFPAHGAVDIFHTPKPYEGSWIDITIGSKHVNTETPHNEKNWGFGIERYAFGRNWQIGSYKNSYYKNTSFILTELTAIPISDTLRLRFNAGIASGYNRTILPGIIPVLTYERKYWGADVLIIPPVANKMGIIALQGKIKF